MLGNLVNMVNPDLLSAAGTFMKLKAVGDKIRAAECTADDLLAIAAEYQLELNPETAAAIAERVPSFIDNLDDTMTNFVANGGLLRMLISAFTNQPPPTSVGRCDLCGGLHFI